MSNEKLKEKLDSLVENFNEEGLNLVLRLAEFIGTDETCDKRTTPERLEEIKREQELKESQRKEEMKKNSNAAFERARAAYNRIKEKKENLPNNYKRLFKRLESISADADMYSISGDEMLMFNDVFNGSLLNGMGAIYNYGFMKGQISEIRKNNKINKTIEYKDEKSIA